MDSWPRSREVEKVKPEKLTQRARHRELRTRGRATVMDLVTLKNALTQFEPQFTLQPTKAGIVILRAVETIEALLNELKK
jgi:hypothetical protein